MSHVSRSQEYLDCTEEQIIELREEIGRLMKEHELSCLKIAEWKAVADQLADRLSSCVGAPFWEAEDDKALAAYNKLNEE